MTNVLIRNIPDDVHRTITRRAEEAGQSVQQYLWRLVVKDASAPTMDEVIRLIGTRTGGRFDPVRAVKDLEDERERR